MSGLNKHLTKYKTLYQQLLRDLPVPERDEVMALRAAYGAIDSVTLQDSYRYAWMVSYLKEAESFDAAADAVSSLTETSVLRSGALMMQAVNHAPEDWKNANESLFYKKGLIRGTTQFYKAKKFLTQGNIFDRFRSSVPVEMKPVITTAIDFVNTNGNEDDLKISPSILCLMMAYMIPEDQGKMIFDHFMEKKETNRALFKESIQKAREAIVILYPRFGIALPASRLWVEHSKGSAATESPASITLNQKLESLGNQLSDHEKEIYSAYVKIRTGNTLHDTMRVVSLFSKRTQDVIVSKPRVTPEFLRATVGKVETLLKEQAGPAKSEEAASPKSPAL